MTPVRSYQGGCHCGRVRFEVRLDLSCLRPLDCDCSIGRKKGFVHAIVPRSEFLLLSGEDALSTYTFGTHVAQHRFCATCGMHPFYTPRSHPEDVDVNLRCLDDDVLDGLEIERFDGRHWEESVGAIRQPTPENREPR